MRSTLVAISLVILAAFPAQAGTDWTGGYLGLSLGYADANDAWDDGGAPTDPTLSPEGGSFAAFAGYTVNLGGFVLGLESDVTVPDLSDNASCDVAIECTFDVELMTSLRGRSGVAFGAMQVYGTAGLAFGFIQADSDELGGTSASKSVAGWTIGSGIEYQVANTLRFGLEYRHSEYSDVDFDLGTPSGDLTLETDEVRARVAIVF